METKIGTPVLSAEQKTNDEMFTALIPQLEMWNGTGNAETDAIMCIAMTVCKLPDGQTVSKIEGHISGNFESTVELILNLVMKNPSFRPILFKAADLALAEIEIESLAANEPEISELALICTCPDCVAQRERNKSNTNVN